jgi:hypothetical protein
MDPTKNQSPSVAHGMLWSLTIRRFVTCICGKFLRTIPHGASV